jgi:homoserine O-acetyltransferase
MPVQGMRLARKLGMATYRSAKEWEVRFGRERASAERVPGDPFGIDFEVESYLESHATKFTGQFDPNCYLYISRAMDLFDLADHGGTVQEALKRFTVERALIIGVETDLLFPIQQQQELADGLAAGHRDVQFVRMPVTARPRLVPRRHGSVSPRRRRLSAAEVEGTPRRPVTDL